MKIAWNEKHGCLVASESREIGGEIYDWATPLSSEPGEALIRRMEQIKEDAFARAERDAEARA